MLLCRVTLVVLAFGLSVQSAGAASVAEVRDLGRALFSAIDAAVARDNAVPRRALPAASAAIAANDNYSPAELDYLGREAGGYVDLLTRAETAEFVVGSTDIRTERVTAGERVDLVQIFSPGMPLPPGSEIVLDYHWSLPRALQNAQPGAANFVSMGGGSAMLAAAGEIAAGLPGGGEGHRVLPMFRVESGSLAPGDTVRIEYRDLDVPDRAYARYRLPVYVRLGPREPLLPVQVDEFAVVPAALDAIRLYGPAGTAPGRATTLLVRLMDRFGNLAAGSFPSLDVLVDGEFSTRLPAGDDPTPVFELTLEAAGVHEVEVRSAGGGLRATMFVHVERSPPNVHWLEPHVHSHRSDAMATDAEIRQRLLGIVDTVWIVDHDNWYDSAGWQARDLAAVDGLHWSTNIRSGGESVVLDSQRIVFDGPPRLAWPSRQRILHDSPESALQIVLPEIPADLRQLDPATTRLVEIQSGDGTYEWYGHALADAGFRVGFTGSSTTHRPGPGPLGRSGRTGLLLEPGESVMDALRARRTWATTGPRIYLDAVVNGTGPGGRAPAAAERLISGEVRGSARIERIELVRNGEVIAAKDFTSDSSASTLQVSFASSSAPLGRDVPRNGREWLGFLRGRGVRITGVDADHLRGSGHKAATINPGDAGRVDFITWTRGSRSSFRVDFETGDEGEAGFDLILASGREDRHQVPLNRPPAEIPPAIMAIGLHELRAGSVVRDYAVAGYRDTVTASLVDTEVSRYANFEFRDQRAPGSVDYYYIRVVQTDDHMAWSSPVFVGGFDPY